MAVGRGIKRREKAKRGWHGVRNVSSKISPRSFLTHTLHIVVLHHNKLCRYESNTHTANDTLESAQTNDTES